MTEPSSQIEVAVLIVCLDGKHHLRDCLPSVLASDDPGIVKHVIVIDNGSTDGTAQFIAERFPQVTCLRSDTNPGFGGGNNLGWRHVQAQLPTVRYLFLLNPDTIAESGWLKPLVDYLEAHPEAGSAQSKLRLHPEMRRLNSAGNRSHYLGFGFTPGYGQEDRGQFDAPGDPAGGKARPIDFASGAALIVRCEVLERLGLFDEDFHMYLEDADLGWKIRQLGLEVVFIPQSVVYHKYHFSAPWSFYECFERNRWWLMLTYYRLGTLVVLAPAIVLMEAGQVLFALRHGLVGQKLRAWGHYLRPSKLVRLWRTRRAAQRRRTIGDRLFMGGFSGTIDLPQLDSPLLHRLANPVLDAYWKLVRPLIRW